MRPLAFVPSQDRKRTSKPSSRSSLPGIECLVVWELAVDTAVPLSTLLSRAAASEPGSGKAGRSRFPAIADADMHSRRDDVDSSRAAQRHFRYELRRCYPGLGERPRRQRPRQR